MNFGLWEDEIVERLEMNGAEVKALPHVTELNDPRPTVRPQLYVIIHGSNLAEPDNLAVISQEETIQGEIFIRSKHRRGEMGIFDLYDKITNLLLGYRLAGTKYPITFGQFGYVTGLLNNWQYSLAFSFTAYRIQGDDPEPDKLIRKITIKTGQYE